MKKYFAIIFFVFQEKIAKNTVCLCFIFVPTFNVLKLKIALSCYYVEFRQMGINIPDREQKQIFKCHKGKYYNL